MWRMHSKALGPEWLPALQHSSLPECAQMLRSLDSVVSFSESSGSAIRTIRLSACLTGVGLQSLMCRSLRMHIVMSAWPSQNPLGHALHVLCILAVCLQQDK